MVVAAASGLVLLLSAVLSVAANDVVSIATDVISSDDIKFLSQWTNVDVDTLRTYETRAGECSRNTVPASTNSIIHFLFAVSGLSSCQ